MVPGVYFFMQSIAMQMVATSMKYTSAGLFATGGASVCHLIMVIVFVGKLEWGFEGVALATTIHLFLRYVFARI